MSCLNIKYNPYSQSERDDFFRQAFLKSIHLPLVVREKIASFGHYGNNNGFILFNGILQEQEPMKTPVSNEDVIFHKKEFFSESVLSIYGSCLGYLYGYKQESQGSLFNNIRPTKENNKEQSSESSDTYLELHKEIAFHDISPDFLLLYCLRGDRTGKALTGVSSIRNVFNRLDSETKSELREKKFKIGIDYSFSKDKGANKEKLISVLNGSPEDPYMVYDADLITPLTANAAKALSNLDKQLRDSMQWINLKSGDLIIIDNNRAVHSRTNFTAFYDGQDRWLQRIFVKKCKIQPERYLNSKLDVVGIDY